MSSKPVSVIIASYNSAPFIVETLESVSNQSWKDLELIITDDCSTDNTVEISRKWINKNKKRFHRVKLVTSEKNTGVPANGNRGLQAATGDWVKPLAADDTLKENCIKDNMDWIKAHPEIRVLFSKVDVFRESFKPENFVKRPSGIPYDPKGIMSHSRTADAQYRMLLVSDRIHYSPSVFLNRETILSLGGFDERFKLIEDHPLWLNLTKNNHKLYFMNKTTVNYRMHAKAINNTGCNYIINPNYFKDEDYRKIYTYPYLPKDIKFNIRYTWYASQIFRLKWLNMDYLPQKILYMLLTVYLNPFKYYLFLKKKFNRQLTNNEFYM